MRAKHSSKNPRTRRPPARRHARRATRQVMIFVHTRRDTVRTAQSLRDRAARENAGAVFADPEVRGCVRHADSVPCTDTDLASCHVRI